MPAIPILRVLALFGLEAVSLAACAQHPGLGGLYTSDDRCIRLHEHRYEMLSQSIAECGMKVPDLSNDPDLQRLAAVEGQPYLRTVVERDNRAHWLFCRLTGDHPGNIPTSTSPFRCVSLNGSMPLDAPPKQSQLNQAPAG